MSGMHRRVFLKGGAVALLALGAPPSFLARAAMAASPLGGSSGRRKTVVFVFQRGAVDGLNMVIPFGDAEYYDARRSIAVEPPRRGDVERAIDLDGFFGLHPALSPLHELYGRGEMSIVHACGSPHPTRSHFDAQDFMETATPGDKATRDGWLNRLLAATDPHACGCDHGHGGAPTSGAGDGRTLDDAAAHASDHAVGQSALAGGGDGGQLLSPLRGVALSAEMPRALRGRYETVAIPDLAEFGVAGGRDESLEGAFDRLYRTKDTPAGSMDLLTDAAEGSFDAIELIERTDPLSYAPRAGVQYPGTDFGRSLLQIAQLIKADAGVEVAFADIGGWDTHVGQGGASGQLANRFTELGRGLRAFCDDLGDRMEDVLVVSMSEFGRTVRENGSGGTDHGHGNCMMVLGGAAAGGQVLGRWPGLEREQLYEGRDLAITTDFRDVFAEVALRHLGADALEANQMESIFPGFAVNPARFVGALR
ncbi:MAG: DUF1501 domain-containing protein [Gemmatimonadota bacterium]|nr:DUF1501 domain-containing protein [Gemmatimonadota bacterium]